MIGKSLYLNTSGNILAAGCDNTSTRLFIDYSISKQNTILFPTNSATNKPYYNTTLYSAPPTVLLRAFGGTGNWQIGFGKSIGSGSAGVLWNSSPSSTNYYGNSTLPSRSRFNINFVKNTTTGVYSISVLSNVVTYPNTLSVPFNSSSYPVTTALTDSTGKFYNASTGTTLDINTISVDNITNPAVSNINCLNISLSLLPINSTTSVYATIRALFINNSLITFNDSNTNSITVNANNGANVNITYSVPLMPIGNSFNLKFDLLLPAASSFSTLPDSNRISINFGIATPLLNNPVKAYSLNANIWSQIGTNITGITPVDDNGTSVSLSNVGNVLITGSPDGTILFGNSKPGCARVYEKTSTSTDWVIRSAILTGDENNSQFGRSVSVSGDGSIIVAGAPNTASNMGSVKTYRYTAPSTYTQVGNTLYGEFWGDQFGTSVKLNNAGNVLAVGAPNNPGSTSKLLSGSVRVYEFVNNSWSRRGLDVDGENANSLSSTSISMNSLGNILAVSDVNVPILDNARVYNFTSSFVLPCLAKSTTVLTPNGYVPIHTLRKGDKILTDDIREVEVVKLCVSKIVPNSEEYPYIIPKDSIGNKYPPQDVSLSGNHLIKFLDSWIHPKNCKKFTQDKSMDIVEYYHLELPDYRTDHIVINGGCVVESYSRDYPLVYKNRRDQMAYKF
jgi:hypothetical protein